MVNGVKQGQLLLMLRVNMEKLLQQWRVKAVREWIVCVGQVTCWFSCDDDLAYLAMLGLI